MDLRDVRDLIDYHYWARDRLLDAVDALTTEQFTRELGNSFSSVRDTLAHLYSAEWVWHNRWRGVSPTEHVSTAGFTDPASTRALWREHEALVRDYIGSLDEAAVQQFTDYRLFSGAAGASPVWQMVQHVVNHATFHRGQVVTMLRQLGVAPPKSQDLITFHRERAV